MYTAVVVARSCILMGMKVDRNAYSLNLVAVNVPGRIINAERAGVNHWRVINKKIIVIK